MRFHRRKYRVLHLGRNNCMHRYILRDDLLERSSVKEPSACSDEKQVCHEPAACPLWPRRPIVSWGALKRGMVSRGKEVFVPSTLPS